MKIIVETTGSFGLKNGREDVKFDRPSVVTRTHLMETRLGNGQLKVLCNKLPEAGNDEDFQKLYAECVAGAKKDTPIEKTALFAIDSYVAVLEAEEEKVAKAEKAAAAKAAKTAKA